MAPPSVGRRGRRAIVIGGAGLLGAAAVLAVLEVLTPTLALDDTLVRASDWIVAGLAAVVGGLLLALVRTRRIASRRERRLLFDSFSGLPTRRFLEREINAAIAAHGSGDGARPIVTQVSLHELKSITDAFGPEYGERVVQALFERFGELTPTTTIARVAADELAALVTTDVPIDELVQIVEGRSALLEHPIEVDGRVIIVRCSAGMAAADRGDDACRVLRKAALALSTARRHPGTICAFAPRMEHDLQERLVLEHDMEMGLVRGEFEVHYQPIVSVGDGRAFGVEALVRWRHPRHGLLAPARFIEIAEANGFIVQLGSYVLAEACRQLAAWRDETAALGDLQLEVNVSPRQLRGREFVTHVRGMLAETRLPASHLTLEVTESTVTDAGAVSRLHELRRMGVKVAVDDFGTGYSSLAYFERLPVDTVKIDKRFVDDIDRRADRATLVSTIVRLARQFGLVAIAEGVERAEQLESLTALGCELVQGYVFARPTTAAAVLPFLLEHTTSAPDGSTTARTVPVRPVLSSVHLTLGPLPSHDVLAWVRAARLVLDDVDDSSGVSTGAVAAIHHYLDEWTRRARRSATFTWSGWEDPELLWSVLRSWFVLAGDPTSGAARAGSLPGTRGVFEEELMGRLLGALAAHDLDGTAPRPVAALERWLLGTFPGA